MLSPVQGRWARCAARARIHCPFRFHAPLGLTTADQVHGP
jgi:hypothetical protein